MSIATVVTRGYGSFGSIDNLPVRGYSILVYDPKWGCAPALGTMAAGAMASGRMAAGARKSGLMFAGCAASSTMFAGCAASGLMPAGVAASEKGC